MLAVTEPNKKVVVAFLLSWGQEKGVVWDMKGNMKLAKNKFDMAVCLCGAA